MTRVRDSVAVQGDVTRRQYNSPVRRAQAAATRAAIVEAAMRAFRECGFERATVGLIAREARVSVQTLYDSIGGKRELLLAVLDRIDGAHFPALAGQLDVIEDPAETIRAWVHGLRRYVEENANLVRAALEAGDDDARAMVAEGHARHLGGAVAVVRQVRERSGQGGGDDPRRASIAAAMATAPAAWYFAIDVAGLSWDETEGLIRESVGRLLLGRCAEATQG